MIADFVHLHTHSEFSLLDGSIRIPELVTRAREYGMSAVALTDHGAMYGIIEFYTTCKNMEIKPIVGCEVYLAPRSRVERTSKDEKLHHLLLLAKDLTGYQNLMKIVSIGYLEGFYYRPRLDNEVLAAHSSGLIALSACLSGKIPKMLVSDRYDDARVTLSQYLDIFGKENFFLEIQNQGLEDQDKVNAGLLKLSEESGVGLVATNDVHYLDKEDHAAHDVLLCIQTGTQVSDENRLHFNSDQFYFKNKEEMNAVFKDCPVALENTLKVAEMCNLEIPLGQNLLPYYKVPEGYDLDSYLYKIAFDNLPKKFPNADEKVVERLRYELDVIKKMGYAGYFLIIWDLIKFARNHDIRVGPGRGSAAGSLLSYVLDITNINPLEYGLLFERFLNPERKSLPDIDIDFPPERRDEIIKYISEKYGENKVAQIITFGTMAARAATRDAARVFGYSYAVGDKLAKLIPVNPSDYVSISKAIEMSEQLRLEYKNNPDSKKILDTAMKLEGLARQDSIHAAGVVISADDLTNYTPLQRKSEPEIVTQYNMVDVQKIGLLKMDILGLTTLTVIDKTLKIIKRTRSEDLDLDKIDLSDEATFQLLRRGDTLGVFQLERAGMRQLLVELRPTCFEDIIALLALYRPGPLQSGLVSDFVAAKHGKKPITYLDPSLKPILKETYGIMVYQEQIMMIAMSMAGFTMSEADDFRAAISKKKRELLAHLREKFINGVIANGYSEQAAKKVFDLINNFGEYGFNKSHSAAYARISFQTAYLKAHYPVEFLAAELTERMRNQEKVVQYLFESKRMSIDILPPDVNESYGDFTVVGDKIRFGLGAIRNVGESVVASIVAERQRGGQYSSFYDFCKRLDSTVLNKRVIESLVKAGAFDSFGRTRKYLLNNFEEIITACEKIKKDAQAGQFSLFAAPQEDFAIRKGENVIDEEFSREEFLAYEKEMLGFYVSEHPLEGIVENLRMHCDMTIEELEDQPDGTLCTIAGIVSKVQHTRTKKGEIMGYVTIDDMTSSIDVIVFPSLLAENVELIVEDKIISVRGRLDVKEDQTKFVATSISGIDLNSKDKQNVNIRIKLSDLDEDTSNHLNSILKSHPGKAYVNLIVPSGDSHVTFRLQDEFRVEVNDLLCSEIKSLLGPGTSIYIS